MKTKSIALFLLFLNRAILPAQETAPEHDSTCAGVGKQDNLEVRYTLDEIFSLAEENETRIRISKVEALMAAEKVKEAKDGRLPDISAGISASYIGNGWMSDRDFSNGRNAPMPHFGNNFEFEATQVIYAGGALRTATEIAEKERDIAELEVDLTRQQTRLMVAGCYLDLFRMKNLTTVYESNALLMEELVKLGESREKEGAALKNDVTRYELQLAEMRLALDKVRTETSVTNYRLCAMLDIDRRTEILPDTTLLMNQPAILSEDVWQLEGNDSPVISIASSSAELAEKNLRMAKADRIPSIAINIADHLDGPILIEVPPLNYNFNYWYAGIGMKIDIGKLYKSSARIRQAKSGVVRSREQLRLAREETETGIQEAYKRYLHSLTELETQTKNVELARENYRIILNRYENGLAIVTDMVDAANMKLSAEVAETNARIGIIYAWYRLRYASGTI